MSLHEALLNNMTLEQLVEQFEATEHREDKLIYTVRGWLMDEIERRNPEGFSEWLDSDNAADSELRKYVL